MFPFCADGPANLAQNASSSSQQNLRINFSDPSTWTSAKPAAVSRLFQRSYPKFGPPHPTNLKVSFDEAPVEHLTFMFGIFMLISMVAICTLFLMKLTKASADSSRRGLGGILPSNCSMVLWMPKSDAHRHHLHHHPHRVAAPTAAGVHQQQHQPYHRRPSSLMILLRSSFSCGAGTTAVGGVPKHRRARNAGATVRTGRSCISVVSSSSLNPLLPPHSLAIITPSPSSSASAGGAFIGCSADDGARGVNSATIKNCAPPPPYDDALAQTKATA
uniref:Uncharacterized protein n=1 Tax=Globodera pallida TaxID=36090 RepID=A0A183C4Y1_GLOPA